MHALRIKLNDATLAVVGVSNGVMFSARINAAIMDEDAATIDVRGMITLGDDRNAHVTWAELLPLNKGDVLKFHFIDSQGVTPPITEVATDSKEYITAQNEYDELLKSNPLTPRQVTALQPDAALQLSIKDKLDVAATLESGREFISFSVDWNKWRADHCRVSLTSFSQHEALARNGGREWFKGTITLGEECKVKVGL